MGTIFPEASTAGMALGVDIKPWHRHAPAMISNAFECFGLSSFLSLQWYLRSIDDLILTLKALSAWQVVLGMNWASATPCG
jgi:hypothetical protein